MTAVAPASGSRWRLLAAWIGLVGFETMAQGALKAGGEALAAVPFGWHWAAAALAEPWVIVGVLGYLGAFAAWMVILDRMPLSKSFPMSSVVALTVVGTSVLAFGETIDRPRALGIVLILAGLAVMGKEEE